MAVHSVQGSYGKMCDCLLLVLTREEDGRWSWVPVRQEEEDPKADLRSLEGGALFQWHLPTLFRRTPAAHVTVSVFCQLAGKALECVSPLWDQPALAWALARGPALRPGCPQGAERRPSGPRRRVGWQSSRAWPPSLCVFPPAPPIPHPTPFPIESLPHSYFCLLTECDLWHLFGCE